jgi:hypothetical protein
MYTNMINRWAKSVARHYAAMEEQWAMPEEYADWPLKKKAADSSSASSATTESISSSKEDNSKDANMPKDTKQVC